VDTYVAGWVMQHAADSPSDRAPWSGSTVPQATGKRWGARPRYAAAVLLERIVSFAVNTPQ